MELGAKSFVSDSGMNEYVDETKVDDSAMDLYTVPPDGVICLRDFEEYAVDRLKLLNVMEQSSNAHPRGSNVYNNFVEQRLKALGLHQKFWFPFFLKCNDGHLLEMKRRDKISHFILRLTYCRSDDLRRWFLQQELDLLRYRFNCTKVKSKILRSIYDDLNPISVDEKLELKSQLVECTRNSVLIYENSNYYKLHFERCFELIRGRKVYLNMGFAYVPEQDVTTILCNDFRQHLSQGLAECAKYYHVVEDDPRIFTRVKQLNSLYLGKDYSAKTFTDKYVRPSDIDRLSKANFPLCMKEMHEALKNTHHLKYTGRIQYGLFLKGIGLRLEDALEFWSSSFCKKPEMDQDTWKKRYGYGVRYNYGKEGKKADFTPYSCVGVIKSALPGAGEVHGCPFKVSDVEVLSQKLDNQNIGKNWKLEILGRVQQSNYPKACTYHLMATHGMSFENRDLCNVVSHPNQFFEESLASKAAGEAAKLPGHGDSPATAALSKSRGKFPGGENGEHPDLKKPKIEDSLSQAELDELCSEEPMFDGEVAAEMA